MCLQNLLFRFYNKDFISSSRAIFHSCACRKLIAFEYLVGSMNGSTLKALHACIGWWIQSPNLAKGCHVHASGLLINIVDLVSISRVCFGSISRSTMNWVLDENQLEFQPWVRHLAPTGPIVNSWWCYHVN